MDIEDRIRQLRKELAYLEAQKNQNIRPSDEPPASPYIQRGPYRTPTTPPAGRGLKTMPYRKSAIDPAAPYYRPLGNG
jgi:hypothetical protein